MIPLILNSKKKQTIVTERRSMVAWNWRGRKILTGKSQEKLSVVKNVLYLDCGHGHLTVYKCQNSLTYKLKVAEFYCV